MVWSKDKRIKLLRYINKFEQYGLRTWNIAERFDVSMSTARRWCYKLADEGLVRFRYEDQDEGAEYYPFCALNWEMAYDPDTYQTLWQEEVNA